MDDTGDYISLSATATGSPWVDLGFTDPTITGCVEGAHAVIAMTSNGTNTNNTTTSIYDGATARVIKSGDTSPGSTLTYYGAVVAAASGRWDDTKLSNATVRISAADPDPEPRWHSMIIEYAVGPF